VDEEYTVSEHGLEWFAGSSVEIWSEILYGTNLKDKLKRDVLTISKQTLTSGQKAQVRENIGAAPADGGAVDKLSAAMSYVVNGNKSIEAVSIPVGAYVRLVNSAIVGRSDGMYTVKTAIPVDTVIDSSYFNESAPIAGGGLNALNSKTSSIISSGICSASTSITIPEDGNYLICVRDFSGTSHYISIKVNDVVVASYGINAASGCLADVYNLNANDVITFVNSIAWNSDAIYNHYSVTKI
jgi:hypothetical protein